MHVSLSSVVKCESVGSIYSKPESLIVHGFIRLLLPLIDIDIIMGRDKSVKVPRENDGVECNLIVVLWIEYNVWYIICKIVRSIPRIQRL